MSGGNDDPQTTQSTQTNKPWDAQAPWLKAVMGEAGRLYADGQGGAYYPGATYVPPTSYENSAFNQITGLAQQGNPLLGGALNQAGSMLKNGGLSQQQRWAGDQISGVADGSQQIGTGDAYGSIYSSASNLPRSHLYGLGIATGDERLQTEDRYQNALAEVNNPTNSQSNLWETAAGRNIGKNNAPLMNVLDRSAQRAGHAVNSAMNGAGRFGSGVHQGVLTRETGDLYERGLSNQMNQDLNRQMQAAGQIDSSNMAAMSQRQGLLSGLTGVQQQNISNKLGAAGQIDQFVNANRATQLAALGGQTGVQGANIANRVGAAQNLNDIYSQGNQLAMQYAGMMPQLNQARYSDANTLMQAGAAQRGELQTELQENVNRWNSDQNRGWEQLARLAQFTSGVIPSGYGTQTNQVPRGSMFSGILGGGLAGGALGSQFGGPWGGLLGLLGGGTMGAFQ
jgi:hypothetical protein